MLLDEINMKLKITPKIETIILDKDNIQQIVGVNFNDSYQQIFNQVYSLAEQELKDALIKLGWTPPKE